MHSESESSPESGCTTSSTINTKCKSLCETLNIELDVNILSSLDVSREIQELSQGVDAIIVNNEGDAGSPDGIAVEEFRSFETVAEQGIPIIEVHEGNIFSDGDSRPYLDSPAINAGLVSGMGLNSYLVAIRALANKLGSTAV